MKQRDIYYAKYYGGEKMMAAGKNIKNKDLDVIKWKREKEIR